MSPAQNNTRAFSIVERVLDAPRPEQESLARRLCGNDAALLRTVLSALSEAGQSALEDELRSTLGDSPAGGLFCPSEATADPGPGELGPYLLVRRIGEGGFGIVDEARQEVPFARTVALKLVKGTMSSREVLARFETERQSLSLMNHPNIARVLDAGTAVTGEPFFVMEFIDGIPITRYCQQKQLGVRGRVELFLSVAAAVQHAHQKGIIHRDLKPANVLVHEIDGVAIPKVIDFGIAKAFNPILAPGAPYTSIRQFVGTPAYMSPEQFLSGGRDIDTRTDVYSLGVMLYELLAGTTPLDVDSLNDSNLAKVVRIMGEFVAQSPSSRVRTAAINADQSQMFTDAHRRRRELRGDLDRVVLKAIERERDQRYETAEALSADLRRYLDGLPVTAHPRSTWYFTKKLLRRHRFAATLAGLGILGTAGTVAGISYGLVREARQRVEAQASAAEARRVAYCATLRSIRHLIDDGESIQAHHLLEECAEELRGWEWSHIELLANGGARPASGRSLDALRAAGEASAQSSPYRWRFGNGGIELSRPDRRAAVFLLCPLTWVCKSYALTASGSRVAAGFANGAIRVYDIDWQSSPPACTLVQTLVGPDSSPDLLAWTDEGTGIACRTAHGRTLEWSVDATAGVYEMPVTHNVLFSGTWSPDCGTIYGGGWGVVFASDGNTGFPRWNSNISRRYVTSLVAMPDGRSLVAMTDHEPSEVFLLDAATGDVEQVWSDGSNDFVPSKPHPSLVKPAIARAVLLDRSRLLVTHAGAALSVIDTASWSAAPVEFAGTQGEPSDSALPTVSSDAARVAVAVRRSRDSSAPDVFILDAASMSTVGTLTLGLGEISSITWSPKGDALLIGTAAGTVAKVRLPDGTPIWTSRSATSAAVEHLLCLNWDSPQPRIVAADRIGMTRWLSPGSGELLYEGHMFTAGLHAVTATPDEQALIGVSLVQFLVRVDRTNDAKLNEARSRALAASRRHADMLWQMPSDLRPDAIRGRTELSEAERAALADFNERRGDAVNAVSSRLLEAFASPAPILPGDFLVHQARWLTEKYPQIPRFTGVLGAAFVHADEPEKARLVLLEFLEQRKARGEPVPLETLLYLVLAEARSGHVDSARDHLRQVEERWGPQEPGEHAVRLVKEARGELGLP